MKTLLLNGQEVEQLLDIKTTVEAVREGYKALGQNKVFMPPISSIDVEEHHGEMDFKMGYSRQEEIIGIKMAGGYWDNPKKYNMPSGLAVICLFNAVNGAPLCILDGTMITGYRTAAAGTLGALCLARKNSQKVGVIGTGLQAKLQVRVLAEYFDIKQVVVHGREESRKRYVEEMAQLLPQIRFVAAETAEEAVRDADIVITTTPSRQALVYDQWIKPGTHINAIGCDADGKQELDPQIFRRAKIVNDKISECVCRGDTQHAIKQGLIRQEDIYAEIGQLLLGEKPGRVSEDEITIFDTTGLSIQDINTSLFIYRKAKQLNMGQEIEIV